MNPLRNVTGILSVFTLSLAQGQLTVSTAMTPAQLVQDVLLGAGVTVSNVTFNGLPGGYIDEQAGSFNGVNTNMGLPNGVILASGNVMGALGPNNSGSFSMGGGNFGFGDVDLSALSGVDTHDAAILEFDFVPSGDELNFRYVFGSEEYNEYVCATVNDAFGFFLSGPGINGPFSNNAINLATLPGSDVPVTINTVNNGTVGGSGTASNCSDLDPNWTANSIYYVDNAGSATIQYDGMTVVLTATSPVVCGETYHIKLAIADGGDTAWDSGVFIEGGSFASTGNVIPAVTDGMGVTPDGTLLEGCGPYEFTFNRLGDTTEELSVDMVVGGTATPGVDYSPAFPAQLLFPPGVESITHVLDIPLDPDGPETIVLNITSVVECSGQEMESEFTFHIDSAEPLTVTLDDIDGLCGETHELTPVVTGGLGQYEYLWSTNETGPSIDVTPGGTTTYTVEVNDVCGVEPVTAESTITIPVYPPVEVTVSPATEIDCLSTGPISVTSANGGNGVYTYAWTVAGQPVGNTATVQVPAGPPTWYVVTVTDGCGTSTQDSVLVSTVPLPPITVSLEPYELVVCPGDTALLQAATMAGGNGVYSLTWTNELGQQVGTGSMVQVQVNGDHTYTLTVSDQCQTTGTAQVQVYLPIYAPFTLQMVPDQTICAGDSLMLHAQVNGGSGLYFIDWPTLGHTDPLRQVQPAMETTYPVVVTDQCGEQITGSTTVGVEYVNMNIVVTNQGQDDWYLQASTLPLAETWQWDMGDGTRYRGKEVYHSYHDLEDHWATLTITTHTGCTGVDSVLLEAPAHIYFPSAFTPDGDGHNDTFGPVGHSIHEFEMTIFNRQGEEVFHTDEMHLRWDGTVNGKEQLTGVYVYKYRAKGHYFPAVEGYGHVTLVAGSQHR